MGTDPGEVSMARPKKLVDEETARKAESCLGSLKNGKLTIQLQAILAVRVHRAKDVADVLMVSKRSIFRWIHLFKEGGMEALKDRPRGHRRSKLSEEQKAVIKKWILEGRTAKGESVLWTIEKLRVAIAEELGISIAKTPLWVHLKKMNLVPRRPGPRHAKADQAAQDAF